MRDLPGSGIEHMPLSLAGGFFEAPLLLFWSICPQTMNSSCSSWSPPISCLIRNIIPRVWKKFKLEFIKKLRCQIGKERILNDKIGPHRHLVTIYGVTGKSFQFSSVEFSRSVRSDSLRPQGLQHARLSCLSPFPGACSNSCPWRQWCHPTSSSSVVPFSSCLQPFSASGSFLMSWLFSSGGHSIGASASVLLMNIQDWLPLGRTGLISLLSNEHGLGQTHGFGFFWQEKNVHTNYLAIFTL